MFCPLTYKLMWQLSVFQQQSRLYSTYKSSPIEGDSSLYTKFVASKSPEEWKWVEALLRPRIVPLPKPKAEYNAGWFPPAGTVLCDYDKMCLIYVM